MKWFMMHGKDYSTDYFHSSERSRRNDMIFLHAIPRELSAVPITELADEIALAMDSDDFYRVAVDPEAIFEHEI